MTIESKGFIATPEDIGALTRDILSAQGAAMEGRGTFLRAELATTIHELGSPIRAHRAGKIAKLAPEEVVRHLAAFNAVHERFLAAVTEAALATLGKMRGAELAKKTAFARSAGSTIRTYIKAGHDITALVPVRVTKGALHVAGKTARRAPSVKRLSDRAETRGKWCVEALLALAEVDKGAARAALEHVVNALREQLGEVGGRTTPTKDPKVAIEEMRPLTVPGTGVFVPSPRLS